MTDNVIISEYTNLLKRTEGFVVVTKEFLDLEYGDMFCFVGYDISFGMKIPLIVRLGGCYNCVDLECGELDYIPEHEQVSVYTQLCIKNKKYREA